MKALLASLIVRVDLLIDKLSILSGSIDPLVDAIYDLVKAMEK